MRVFLDVDVDHAREKYSRCVEFVQVKQCKCVRAGTVLIFMELSTRCGFVFYACLSLSIEYEVDDNYIGAESCVRTEQFSL